MAPLKSQMIIRENMKDTERRMGRASIATWVIGLAVFCVVFLVFLPAIHNEFVNFDDGAYVVDNPLIDLGNGNTLFKIFSDAYYYAYIPITLLSHAIDWQIWGTYPSGHHITSVVIHAVNAVLLFLLSLAFMKKRANPLQQHQAEQTVPGEILFGASCAALFFALHPLRAESVDWVSDRKDILAAFFLLSGCLMYVRLIRIRGLDLRPGHVLVLTITGLLAATSKNFAVAYPLLLLLCDVVVLDAFDRRTIVKMVRQKLPMFAVSLLVGLAALHAAPSEGIPEAISTLDPMYRVLLPFYSMVFYAVKTLVPTHLVVIYVTPTHEMILAGSAGCALLLSSCVVAVRRKWRPWWAAWTAYALLVAPTIGGIATGGQLWADRYSYLATPPLFLMVGVGVARLLSQNMWMTLRWSVVAACCVILGLLTLLTITQNSYWRTSESLWEHQFSEGAVHSAALNNLGLVRISQGRKIEAREMFLKAIQINSHAIESATNLADACSSHEDSLQTFALYQNSRASQPGNQKIETAMAGLFLGFGQKDSAIALYRQALALDSMYVPAINGLAMLYFESGEKDSARVLLARGLRASPGCARLYFNLGVYFGDAGRDDLALLFLQRSARLGDTRAREELSKRGYSW